jgi:hypothetical protein
MEGKALFFGFERESNYMKEKKKEVVFLYYNSLLIVIWVLRL